MQNIYIRKKLYINAKFFDKISLRKFSTARQKKYRDNSPVSVLFHIFYLLLFAFFCFFYFSDC